MANVTRYACGLPIRNGQILLGKRSPHRRIYPGVWDVIGGKVEAGETVEQALVRELREEIGVEPTLFEPIGIVEDNSLAAGGVMTYHMFLVRGWLGGTPAIRDHEHTKIAWFSPADAAAIPDLAVEDYRALFKRIGRLI
jgi:8-oxo-dGTP diphosphatase